MFKHVQNVYRISYNLSKIINHNKTVYTESFDRSVDSEALNNISIHGGKIAFRNFISENILLSNQSLAELRQRR